MTQLEMLATTVTAKSDSMIQILLGEKRMTVLSGESNEGYDMGRTILQERELFASRLKTKTPWMGYGYERISQPSSGISQAWPGTPAHWALSSVLTPSRLRPQLNGALFDGQTPRG